MSEVAMVTIYGIKNCDTMKKAMTWLSNAGIEYQFHDYKKEGISEALAQAWIEALPIDALINKRGTTWRNLPEEDKVDLSKEKAVNLICANPSLVKRPLLDTGEERYLGFKPEQYQEVFA